MYLLENSEHVLQQFPYTDIQLKADNPGALLPKTLTPEIRAAYGMRLVILGVKPDVDFRKTELDVSQPSYNVHSNTWHAEYIEIAKDDAVALEAVRQDLIQRVDTTYQSTVWSNIPYQEWFIQLRNETDRATLHAHWDLAKEGIDPEIIMENDDPVVIPALTFADLMRDTFLAASQLKVLSVVTRNQLKAATTMADLEAIDLGPFAQQE